jgi:hypothetical protein
MAAPAACRRRCSFPGRWRTRGGCRRPGAQTRCRCPLLLLLPPRPQLRLRRQTRRCLQC